MPLTSLLLVPKDFTYWCLLFYLKINTNFHRINYSSTQVCLHRNFTHLGSKHTINMSWFHLNTFPLTTQLCYNLMAFEIDVIWIAKVDEDRRQHLGLLLKFVVNEAWKRCLNNYLDDIIFLSIPFLYIGHHPCSNFLF